jgi:RNA polymerase sigma-70 factor, ECF subfamily
LHEVVAPAHVRRPDADLVASLIGGDEAAFQQLVATHHDTMLRVARGYVRSASVADEVVQETWVAILKALPRFEGRSSLKTWMFRILANRARTRAKREMRTVPMSALGAADDEPVLSADTFTASGGWNAPPAAWHDPTSKLDRSELGRILEDAIAQLPERQQLVITLRDVRGWTSEEVCNVLEVSETNQRVLLHRARTKVRATLAPYLQGDP